MMHTIHPTLSAVMGSQRLLRSAIAIGLLALFAYAPSGSAQTPTPLPLGLDNNYMVTGDYVVGGWTKTGSKNVSGTLMSTGTITIPDPIAYGGASFEQQVPVGADIVAAFLYWQSVESSGTFAGQNGTFRGYPITGTILGNPNAPVSWSSGGCAGSSQGSKTIVTYRADVSSYVPVDANGNIQPNTTYQVNLPDTGKAGQPPFTLGATLVIVYRVLAPASPLTAVIIYDGSYAPGNTSQPVSQPMLGFYQAGNDQNGPIATKITHIVGNGQSNKLQQVYLNNYNSAGTVMHSTLLPSLYGTNPPFPGKYNSSWDNPTWFISNGQTNYTYTTLPVQGGESSETTVVVPNGSNKGCVSWGAIVMSTTVQDSDLDGLIDGWKTAQGYCDAGSNRGLSTQGTCPLNTSDPSWVALPGAHVPRQGNKDVFVQLDYMCSAVINSNGTTTCDTSKGVSYGPSAATLSNVASAFGANHNITLHIIPDDNNVILAQPCTDNLSPAVYCPYPGQAGVVGWEAGFAFLKTQPLNYPDEISCETQTPQGGTPGSGPACVRRFQPGKNNSYHEVIFGVGAASPSWGFIDGSLATAVAAGTTVTFTTSTPHGLAAAINSSDTNPNARVTISDAISNPGLNGTYLVASVPSSTSFTIQIATATNATYTQVTDPFLAIGSGVPTTRSGISDIGGADSLITLGLWGPDGRTDQVQSGTLMHELGHSLGLTHGGLSRTPVTGGYVFTFEPNCKSNHLSVMNYMFQVDLLDGNLDYSGEVLPPLNESLASPANILSNVNQTTKWYAPNQPFGSPATSHCDGSPITPNDPNKNMFRLEGPASSITWSANQDINFDGLIEASLDGYDDWASLDLRQIGATGNDFWASGGVLSSKTGGGVLSSKTGGGVLSSKTGGGVLSSKTGGGVLSSKTGGGVGSEINTQTANSVVRPSKITSGPVLTASNFVQFSFTAPTFGQNQIASFNVYRSANNAAPALIANVPVPAGTTLPLPTFTFTDQKVSCGAVYTYFVTTVLTDGRESTLSSASAPISVPCMFVGFLSPLSTASKSPTQPTFSGPRNLGNAVPIKWELLDANGNPISDLSTLKLMQACPTTSPSPTAFPASSGCVLIYSPLKGGEGSTTFRYSAPNFIINWDTGSLSGLAPGYWTIELQLTDGRLEWTNLQF
ncbi:MAG TPA: hypothetical protein VGR58_08525 [Candidatus Acidoferrum sp.]|nr:hypothetical protein [Candidatus Acidoferrum sp.]